ncbi:MAG TPA: glycosyltransferase [Vicinamibacteria bacterium]|nr:glycosyltransferase [Vicinamibacteria bacterium]
MRGTPLAVLALVRALAGLGHRVDLLTFAQGEDVSVPGVRHLRSLRLPLGHVRAGASLAKLVLDVPFMARAAWRMAVGGYDVVHAVEEAAHLAAPLARLLRLPLVADVDSSLSDQLVESGFARRGPLLWAARRLERHALRHSAAVITVCGSLTDLVRERAPAANVFQIEDPPLVEEAPPDVAAVDALRRELGLDGRKVALYSGNFEPYQGVPLLLEAAAALPDVQFVFMGGEPAQVAAARESALALGCGERCLFTGKRPPAELARFLALADVVVSPRCRGVNTPFKVYTYLASGRPLVATRIPTHTQLLDDSLAFLVEPTPDALAAGIRAALAGDGEPGRRARRGQELIRREYSRARFEEKVREAYAAVAAP